jgi:hypothetical protein
MAALAALVVSLIHVWVSAHNRRQALVAVSFSTVLHGRDRHHSLIVGNRGAGTARDVRVSFTINGEEWTPRLSNSLFPIPVLASGHSIATSVTLLLGDVGTSLPMAHVSWKHGRFSRRRRYSTSVSTYGLAGSAGLTTEFVEQDMAWRMRS